MKKQPKLEVLLFTIIAVICLTGCSTSRLNETAKEEPVAMEFVTLSSKNIVNAIPITISAPIPTPEPLHFIILLHLGHFSF